jgi:hypothetical protein
MDLIKVKGARFGGKNKIFDRDWGGLLVAGCWLLVAGCWLAMRGLAEWRARNT